VLQGVEGCAEAKGDGELESPGLARDQAVAAEAVFAGVGARDVGRVAEGQVVHTDTFAGRGEESEPELQVQLDVGGEAGVAALGRVVFGGANAAHEVAGLGDEEATMVQAADERVQGRVGHGGRVVEHGLDGGGPGDDFVGGEGEEQPAGVDYPTKDSLHFGGGGLRQELRDGQDVIAFNRVGRVRRPAEKLEDER
jgi:hypothetical protein